MHSLIFPTALVLVRCTIWHAVLSSFCSSGTTLDSTGFHLHLLLGEERLSTAICCWRATQSR